MLRLVIAAILLSGFIGTLLWLQPAKPSAPADLPASMLQGVWHVVGIPEQVAPGPFSEAWFALQPTTPERARLSWARDGWCSQVDTTISGHELNVVTGDTRVIVAFHADATATATMYQGDHQVTQTYVKQRDSVPACNWLLE